MNINRITLLIAIPALLFSGCDKHDETPILFYDLASTCWQEYYDFESMFGMYPQIRFLPDSTLIIYRAVSEGTANWKVSGEKLIISDINYTYIFDAPNSWVKSDSLYYRKVEGSYLLKNDTSLIKSGDTTGLAFKKVDKISVKYCSNIDYTGAIEAKSTRNTSSLTGLWNLYSATSGMGKTSTPIQKIEVFDNNAYKLYNKECIFEEGSFTISDTTLYINNVRYTVDFESSFSATFLYLNGYGYHHNAGTYSMTMRGNDTLSIRFSECWDCTVWCFKRIIE